MEQNKTYIIRIDVGNNKVFTYTAKIISEDNLFITFLDSYGKTLTYNKNKIIGYEEVSK